MDWLFSQRLVLCLFSNGFYLKTDLLLLGLHLWSVTKAWICVVGQIAFILRNHPYILTQFNTVYMYMVKFTWDKFAISVGAIFGNVEHVDWKLFKLVSETQIQHKISPYTNIFDLYSNTFQVKENKFGRNKIWSYDWRKQILPTNN